MLDVTFRIKIYNLEYYSLDDSNDYSFLERIGERYDFMLYESIRSDTHNFKVSLYGEYNPTVAIKDILSDLRNVEIEEFSFKLSFDKPSQRS